jgi:hypothetical protein
VYSERRQKPQADMPCGEWRVIEEQQKGDGMTRLDKTNENFCGASSGHSKIQSGGSDSFSLSLSLSPIVILMQKAQKIVSVNPWGTLFQQPSLHFEQKFNFLLFLSFSFVPSR